MLYLFKEKTHQHDKDMHSGKSKGILFRLYIEFETYETFSLLFQILFRIRNIINKFALTYFYWNVKNNTKFSSFISSSAEMLYLFKEKTHEYDKDMQELVHTINDNNNWNMIWLQLRTLRRATLYKLTSWFTPSRKIQKLRSFISSLLESIYLFKETTYEHDNDMQ